MRIIIHYSKRLDGKIASIMTFGHFMKDGKTEQEIEDAIIRNNEEVGFEMFAIKTVSPELEDIFKFFLGEDEYKTQYNISQLYNKMCEVKDELEEIESDCFHACENLESQIKKISELVPDEDKEY